MEAALAERGVDYRDRWRVDPATGRPLLTLRRIAVLVLRHPPHRNPIPVAVEGYEPFSRLEELVDDVRRSVQAAAHKMGHKDPPLHPDRDRARLRILEAQRAERERVARERLAKRRRELALLKGG